MSGTKNRKRGGKRPDRRQPPRRRTPPPDATGDESKFFGDLQQSGAPVRLLLRDGSHVEGRVQSFNSDTLSVRDEKGGDVVVRKLHIRYLEEKV